MFKKLSKGYLLLVFLQALHSIEEYFGQLWEVFPPARFLCSLISDDLHFGFLVINIGLFVFGVLFWCFVVRKNRRFALGILWFWIVIELINGIGHPLWTIIEGGYTPGVITAPFLLITAIYLIKIIYDDKVRSSRS